MIVLGAFAVVVGILNVVAQHFTRIRRRDARAPYSVALLIGLVIPPGVAIAQYATGRFSDNIGPLFEDIVRWVYTPLSASLLALLTFFGITAAVHALRGGNREAIVIVIVAALVLIIQLPLLSGVPIAGEISRWLHDYIALAGARRLGVRQRDRRDCRQPSDFARPRPAVFGSLGGGPDVLFSVWHA